MNKMMILAASILASAPFDMSQLGAPVPENDFDKYKREPRPEFSEEEKLTLATLTGRAKKKYLRELKDKYEII